MAQQMVTEEKFSELDTNLQLLPHLMEAFSLSMRSLYAENYVGEDFGDFQSLRDNTRDDAMVYMSGILPMTTTFVSNLQEYFENYTALTYDEWEECLADIIEETDKYKEIAEVLVKLYENFISQLKKRQDQANGTLSEMKELTEEYEQHAANLRYHAKVKHDWALALGFIPFLNLAASPILHALGNKDLANAVAKCEQGKIAQAASLTVAHVLIPALADFIRGLTITAGFLNILHQELVQMSGQGHNAIENPKRLYYYKMRSKAGDIIEDCRNFYAVIPSVKTDIGSIPSVGTDKNYVNAWLENQKALIRSGIKSVRARRTLLKSIRMIL